MPATYRNRVERAFGESCILAVTDWRQFLSHLDDNAVTVTGTLEEVSTNHGVGLRVAAANSYAQINWRGLAPLGTTPRSVVARAYLPDNGADYALAAWGANVNNDGFLIENASGLMRGGFVGDNDSAGAVSAAWLVFGTSNLGTNGGINAVYRQGVQTIAGANGADGVTAYSNFYVFRTPWGTGQCPVGTILQELLVFDRVLSDADHLAIFNKIIGNA